MHFCHYKFDDYHRLLLLHYKLHDFELVSRMEMVLYNAFPFFFFSRFNKKRKNSRLNDSMTFLLNERPTVVQPYLLFIFLRSNSFIVAKLAKY